MRGQRANGRPALRENRPERRGDPRETGLPVAPSWELALSWVGPTLYNGRRLRFRLLEQMTEPARILVVDEDADHLDIVATLLDHHGYRVELETTPEAGLEAAQRNPPDAIITALHFGGLPAGLSFIDRLRESRETASIPIVVVSSFTDIHERELRARGVRFVQKGAHLGRIVDQLDTLLKTG